MTDQLIDMLHRPVKAGDFVVYYNNIYQVNSVGNADNQGFGRVRMILVDKAKTTKSVVKYSKEVCVIPEHDVLIWRLKQ